MDKLKELVERLNKHKYGAEQDLLSALHSVTNILTTISEAEGLPEKKVDYDHNGVTFVESITDYEKGFNECLEKIKPLLHKKTLELAKKDITIVFKDIEIAELEEELHREAEEGNKAMDKGIKALIQVKQLQAENTDWEEECHLLKAKLDKGRIEGILADPTHWCPSKAEQWKRIANAIIEDK